MQASSLKSCGACRIGCLPGGVAIRLGLLLSSLSLCLRFGSLTQFPPTLDLYKFAIACRGGFAGARRSTHYQDDMHCQLIRLHQNKMSRAAADDRSRPNRIAMLTRLRRAQESAIGKHRTSSSCSLAMKNSSRKRTSTFILKNSLPMLSVNWCRLSMWMPRISPAESGCSTSISSTMGWGTSLWMNWKQKKRRDRSHAKSSPFRELLQILFYGNSALKGEPFYSSSSSSRISLATSPRERRVSMASFSIRRWASVSV